jgi:hypothetical protein
LRIYRAFINLVNLSIVGWTQDKGAMDMGLVERDMHCIAPLYAPYMPSNEPLTPCKEPYSAEV